MDGIVYRSPGQKLIICEKKAMTQDGTSGLNGDLSRSCGGAPFSNRLDRLIFRLLAVRVTSIIIVPFRFHVCACDGNLGSFCCGCLVWLTDRVGSEQIQFR